MELVGLFDHRPDSGLARIHQKRKKSLSTGLAAAQYGERLSQLCRKADGVSLFLSVGVGGALPSVGSSMLH